MAALTATVDALARLVNAGITSGHARYGEQVKRAIDAHTPSLRARFPDDAAMRASAGL